MIEDPGSADQDTQGSREIYRESLPGKIEHATWQEQKRLQEEIDFLQDKISQSTETCHWSWNTAKLL